MTAVLDGEKLHSNGFQLLHIGTFKRKRRMNISIQGDFGAGVTQNFTQGFDLHTNLYASSGKGVSQNMKMNLLQAASRYKLF